MRTKPMRAASCSEQPPEAIGRSEPKSNGRALLDRTPPSVINEPEASSTKQLRSSEAAQKRRQETNKPKATSTGRFRSGEAAEKRGPKPTSQERPLRSDFEAAKPRRRGGQSQRAKSDLYGAISKRRSRGEEVAKANEPRATSTERFRSGEAAEKRRPKPTSQERPLRSDFEAAKPRRRGGPKPTSQERPLRSDFEAAKPRRRGGKSQRAKSDLYGAISKRRSRGEEGAKANEPGKPRQAYPPSQRRALWGEFVAALPRRRGGFEEAP